MRTDEDVLNMLAANRKHDEMQPIISKVQARIDRIHAQENVHPFELRVVAAAVAAGADPHPWMIVASKACVQVGCQLAWITERSERGGLLRGQGRHQARLKVMTIMREAGLSYPEIASVFKTGHSTVITALNRLAVKPTPARVVRMAVA
jgi:hypothetical protein